MPASVNVDTAAWIIGAHSVEFGIGILAATTRHRESQPIRAPAPESLRFNTHTDPPRPPQTPAASFKRLYRE